LGGALLLVVALLTLAVPLAVMLQGAGVPPGILWNDEARAYDALEYHLQCPREYYDAGRIQFLPHNVYASFPQQMELLYLLLMHLLGGPHAAAIAAQFLHALCGILAVMAIAAWTPAGWARVAAIVAAGSTPWLAYLGCLAYVELGMVAFGAVAAGILVEQVARGGAAGWTELLAAGLWAGLAGGGKYTALALVLVGLMVAWLIVMGVGRRKGALKGVLWLGIGGLVAFSPWLVRNAAFAGNPVYPFAYRWLGGKAWSAEQDEQWHRGHAPPPAIRSLGGRVQTTVNELFGSRMFGPTLFVLAAGGLAVACSNRGRRREETAAAVFLGVAALLIIVGWAALTHMPGRFAVPVIVPLALLVGRGTAAMPRWPAMLLVGLAAAGAAVNDVKTAGEWEAHNLQWKRHGFPLRELAGWVGVVEDADLVNRVAPAQARVWLVGRATPFYITRSCHYTVVFSRDPWLEMARTATPAQAVDWLRTQGVTHVVFSWPEIERLRRTYGFPEWVTKSWVQTLTEGGLRRAAIPPDAPDTGEEVYEVLAK